LPFDERQRLRGIEGRRVEVVRGRELERAVECEQLDRCRGEKKRIAPRGVGIRRSDESSADVVGAGGDGVERVAERARGDVSGNAGAFRQREVESADGLLRVRVNDGRAGERRLVGVELRQVNQRRVERAETVVRCGYDDRKRAGGIGCGERAGRAVGVVGNGGDSGERRTGNAIGHSAGEVAGQCHRGVDRHALARGGSNRRFGRERLGIRHVRCRVIAGRIVGHDAQTAGPRGQGVAAVAAGERSRRDAAVARVDSHADVGDRRVGGSITYETAELRGQRELQVRDGRGIRGNRNGCCGIERRGVVEERRGERQRLVERRNLVAARRERQREASGGIGGRESAARAGEVVGGDGHVGQAGARRSGDVANGESSVHEAEIDVRGGEDRRQLQHLRRLERLRIRIERGRVRAARVVREHAILSAEQRHRIGS